MMIPKQIAVKINGHALKEFIVKHTSISTIGACLEVSDQRIFGWIKENSIPAKYFLFILRGLKATPEDVSKFVPKSELERLRIWQIELEIQARLTAKNLALVNKVITFLK